MKRHIATLLLLAILLVPLPAHAQTCSFSITDLDFGSITTSSNTNFDTSGIFTANCSGASGASVTLCVNIAGGSGGIDTDGDPRYLLSGTTQLQYMLYRNSILASNRWGSSLDAISQTNGVFAAIELNLAGTGSTSITMRGRVPSGQTAVPAGVYTSSFSGHAQVSYAINAASCPALGTTNATSVPFTVMAINGNACSVSTSVVDFGSHGVLTSNVDVTGAVNVVCTSGLSYKISLGSGANGTIAQRKMKGSGSTATLDYNLYSESTRTTVWGTQTVTGTGTGFTQAHTVYARLPVQTTPRPDTYADTVVVTIEY